VVTYLVLQGQHGRVPQVVAEGLEDFTEQLPGAGGMLGRLFKRPATTSGPSADEGTNGGS
jgi:hypothetical protein